MSTDMNVNSMVHSDNSRGFLLDYKIQCHRDSSLSLLEEAFTFKILAHIILSKGTGYMSEQGIYEIYTPSIYTQKV